MSSYYSAVSELDKAKSDFDKQSADTESRWSDSVKRSFYRDYVNGYGATIDQAASGLREVGDFLDRKKNEMQSLLNSVY